MANGNDLAQAYSILGQATTSEYNRRRREEEEREKRMMRRQLLATFAQPLVQSAGQAFAGAVGDLVSSPFERKYEEFSNLEEIQKLRRAQKQGELNSKFVDDTYDKIMSSNKTQEDWFYEDMLPSYIEEGERRVRAEGKDPAVHKESIEAWAAQAARPAAKQRSAAFTSLHKERQDLGKMEDFDRLIAFNNKRPKDAIAATTRYISRAFGGKDQKQLDEEGLKAIQESGLIKEQSQFDAALEVFRKTGKYEDAAPFVKASMKVDPGVGVDSTKISFSVEDDVIVYDQTIDQVDNYGNTVTSVKVPIRISYLEANEDGTKKVDDAALLKAATTTNNLFERAEKILKPEAFALYTKTLLEQKNKDGGDSPIVLTNIKSIDEYTQASIVLSTIMENSENLKNPTRDQRETEIFKTLATKEFPVIFESFEAAATFFNAGTEEQKEEAKKQLEQIFQYMLLVSQSMATSSAVDVSTRGTTPFSNL